MKSNYLFALANIESEYWAEANAQTKINNQSMEVVPGPKQTSYSPRFFYPVIVVQKDNRNSTKNTIAIDKHHSPCWVEAVESFEVNP